MCAEGTFLAFSLGFIIYMGRHHPHCPEEGAETTLWGSVQNRTLGSVWPSDLQQHIAHCAAQVQM